MEEKWSIDKLDGTNWPTWTFQMKHLLLAKGLRKIVDGTETLKVGASSELEVEFQKNSQRAFSTIVLGMQCSQLYLITSTEEPKAAWDALKNISREKRWQTSCSSRKGISEWKCKKDNSDSPEGEMFPGAFTASERHASKAKQEMLWLIDSGASSHMTNNQEILSQFKAMKVPENVVLADDCTVKAQGSGIGYMKMMFDKTSARKAVLYNVLYVPDLKCNLFSIRAAVANGNVVKFGGDKCWLRDANGVLRGMGTLLDKMYQLNCESLRNNQRALVVVNNEADLWHQRLGHLHEKGLQKCIDKGYLNGSTVTKINRLSFCEGCVAGKFDRKPFVAVGEIRSRRKLELVHSDVCGPMQTASIGGAKYFVTFIDDYTRCCSVFFLRHKSEVFDKFKEFEALTSGGEDEKILVLKTGKSFMKYKSEERIRALRTDNGGEYTSSEFEKYLKDKVFVMS